MTAIDAYDGPVDDLEWLPPTPDECAYIDWIESLEPFIVWRDRVEGLAA